MEPTFPGQRLLPAPREIIKKVIEKKEFFDFGKHSDGVLSKNIISFVVLVVVLVAGYYLLSPLISKISTNQDLVGAYVPVSTLPKSMNMDIQNPDDELLVYNKTVVVSGRTAPKSAVVITNGDNFFGTEADGDGQFQKVIDLTPGQNQLNIQAFDPDGNTKSDSRMVFYTEDKL